MDTERLENSRATGRLCPKGGSSYTPLALGVERPGAGTVRQGLPMVGNRGRLIHITMVPISCPALGTPETKMPNSELTEGEGKESRGRDLFCMAD